MELHLQTRYFTGFPCSWSLASGLVWEIFTSRSVLLSWFPSFVGIASLTFHILFRHVARTCCKACVNSYETPRFVLQDGIEIM